MKFGLTNVNETFHEVVEINTIEELIKLQKKCYHGLILYPNPSYYGWDEADKEIPQEFKECEFRLEIYNDYRE